jgi:uncharacterized protein YukE
MTYGYSRESMLEAQRFLDQTSKAINTNLNEVESACQKSLVDWTGEAVKAYEPTRLEWRNAADTIADLVQKAGVLLAQMYDDMENTERGNMNSWG